ncbi:MAG TPA: hypothetical protein DCF33_07930 [Saprospirales bacterium]|nr:hypothetical protein [Saprospirales bacterium]
MTDQVFGSLSGGGHNNGGISQYDEKGVVYQAICSYSEFVEPFDAMPGAFDEEQSPSYEAAV